MSTGLFCFDILKDKVKIRVYFPLWLIKRQAMKMYGRRGVNKPTASLINNLGTKMEESGVVSISPRPLYLQGKSPWDPLDRRLDATEKTKTFSPAEK
jgi:hypothetical protein